MGRLNHPFNRITCAARSDASAASMDSIPARSPAFWRGAGAPVYAGLRPMRRQIRCRPSRGEAMLRGLRCNRAPKGSGHQKPAISEERPTSDVRSYLYTVQCCVSCTLAECTLLLATLWNEALPGAIFHFRRLTLHASDEHIRRIGVVMSMQLDIPRWHG
jgi:hypothetical protein